MRGFVRTHSGAIRLRRALHPWVPSAPSATGTRSLNGGNRGTSEIQSATAAPSPFPWWLSLGADFSPGAPPLPSLPLLRAGADIPASPIPGTGLTLAAAVEQCGREQPGAVLALARRAHADLAAAVAAAVPAEVAAGAVAGVTAASDAVARGASETSREGSPPDALTLRNALRRLAVADVDTEVLSEAGKAIKCNAIALCSHSFLSRSL